MYLSIWAAKACWSSDVLDKRIPFSVTPRESCEGKT